MNFSTSKSIIQNLNFTLTKDQFSAYKEIKKDISGKSKMYRLIQGDVGSGKTIISLLTVADFIKSGFQCVIIMVPTEVLAKQHFSYFESLFSELNIKTTILTSKKKTKIKFMKI